MARCLSLLLIALLVGCTTVPSTEERKFAADRMAVDQGWHAVSLSTETFDLVSYVPDGYGAGERLTVYIEGDGFAWRTPSLPSSDPTPIDPLALKLALAHPGGNAAYLARPCQYNRETERHPCPQRYWMGSRYAPEVLAAMSSALDQLKQRFKARRLTVVGYSGGGAIAALLAAERDDIDHLVTVAGNLDHRAWTSKHRIKPLKGSLSPVERVERLKHIRQWHFAGGNDKIVPADLIQSFVDRFPAGSPVAVLIMPEFDHHCCWIGNWPRLWAMTRDEE